MNIHKYNSNNGWKMWVGEGRAAETTATTTEVTSQQRSLQFSLDFL